MLSVSICLLIELIWFNDVLSVCYVGSLSKRCERGCSALHKCWCEGAFHFCHAYFICSRLSTGAGFPFCGYSKKCIANWCLKNLIKSTFQFYFCRVLLLLESMKRARLVVLQRVNQTICNQKIYNYKIYLCSVVKTEQSQICSFKLIHENSN